MLLLHISDIHFKAPICLSPDQDPDRPIRTRIMRSMREELDKLGKDVDAILVGGDIAYKADKSEYETAMQWLLELAALGKCSDKRIFVVPGNHDVDRGHTGQDVGTQNVQYRLASAKADDREDLLRKLLGHEQSGRDLLSGHEAYNEFAAPMSCQIYPSKIAWHQDIDLTAEVKLRIHGLTSTILSGRDGKDDNPRDLYLGMLQTVLDPVEDRVNLIICHHPPDWLADGDDVEDAINARATLQLFGHKHRQRVVSSDDYVRILAGAVNPSRKERNYEAGYNLIDVSIAGGGPDRTIEIETYQFRYQSNPERFDPVKTSQGKDTLRKMIPFPTRPKVGVSPALATVSAIAEGDLLVADPSEPTMLVEVEAAMGNERQRDLVSRFWQLPGDKKREIVFALGLIEESELALPEPERYGTALLRAGAKGLLDEVAKMIAEREAS